MINPWPICTEASEHSQLGRVVGHYAYQAVCMSPHYIDEAIYNLDMGSVVFSERNHFIFELVMRHDN